MRIPQSTWARGLVSLWLLRWPDQVLTRVAYPFSFLLLSGGGLFLDLVLPSAQEMRTTNLQGIAKISKEAGQLRRDVTMDKIQYGEYLKSKHWMEKRKKALDRAKYRCQICNCNKSLQVHHRNYSDIGNERICDLTVLCDECHGIFHNKKRVFVKVSDSKRERGFDSFADVVYAYSERPQLSPTAVVARKIKKSGAFSKLKPHLVFRDVWSICLNAGLEEGEKGAFCYLWSLCKQCEIRSVKRSTELRGGMQIGEAIRL